MKIPVDQLVETPGKQRVFTFTEEAGLLDLDDEWVVFTGPLQVRVEAVYNDGEVLLKCSLRTNADLVCSRCLKNFSFSLSGESEEKIKVEGKSVLDVTDLVRESYFAGFPLKPLCEPSCKGLCANCGNDLNEKQCDCRHDHVDHRLAVLEKLLKQD